MSGNAARKSACATMIEQVAKTIARYSMFQPGQRMGVAVSGGADSVCLLHVLQDLAPRWNLRQTVLHLDHKLRGEESRQDAAFVRFVAVRRNVGLLGDNLEQAARAGRPVGVGFFPAPDASRNLGPHRCRPYALRRGRDRALPFSARLRDRRAAGPPGRAYKEAPSPSGSATY